MRRRSNAQIRAQWSGGIESKGVQTNRDWIHQQWIGEADPNWVHRMRGQFASAARGLAEAAGEATDVVTDATPHRERVGGTGLLRGLGAHAKAAEEAFTGDLRGGYSVSSWAEKRGRNALIVRGEIYQGETRVGKFKRFITDEKDGRRMVEHSEAMLEPDIQGAGIMAEVNAKAAKFYDSIGVDGVTLIANMDVGGAAWANQGFKFDRGAHADVQGVGTLPDRLKDWTDFLNGDSEAGEITPSGFGEDWVNLDTMLGTMGLKHGDSVVKKIAEDLKVARQGVLDGTYDPADVYYTGYDTHQWTETLADGRTVTMWPGKKAMMGSAWVGINRDYLNDFLTAEQRSLNKASKVRAAAGSASDLRERVKA